MATGNRFNNLAKVFTDNYVIQKVQDNVSNFILSFRDWFDSWPYEDLDLNAHTFQSGNFKALSGSVAEPSYSFVASKNSGLYLSGSDVDPYVFLTVSGSNALGAKDNKHILLYGGLTVTGTIESTGEMKVFNFSPGLQLRDRSTTANFRLGVDQNLFKLSIDSDDDDAVDANGHYDDIPNALVVANSGRVGVGTASPSSLLEIEGSATGAAQLLTLDQDDTDQPFVDFQGSSAANATNTISTYTAGNSIQGFLQIEVNGTKRWIPFYDDPTS